MEMTYKVSDLKKLIAESSNEFKAVIGAGVESDNKKNNGKAYSDAKKRAKDYDGGLKKEEDWARGDAKYEKTDGNKTTLDYNPENVSDDCKKRWKAQAKGYTSEAEMNNGLEKTGDFSDNENIYNGIKKSGKEIHKNIEDFKKTGLQASKMPEKTFEKDEMYESKDGFDMRNLINSLRANTEMKSTIKENVSVDTFYFKKKDFLNEANMLSRIPDECKVEGRQFKMKDKSGSEYLVEWHNNSGKILSHTNKNGMVESVNRMNALAEYTTKDTKTTNAYRINEGEDAFTSTLDKARRIIK